MTTKNLLTYIVEFVTRTLKGENEDQNVRNYNFCMTVNSGFIPIVKGTNPTMHSKRFIRPYDTVDNFCWINQPNIYRHPNFGILRIGDITKSEIYDPEVIKEFNNYLDYEDLFYHNHKMLLENLMDEDLDVIDLDCLILFGDKADMYQAQFIIHQLCHILRYAFNICASGISYIIVNKLATFYAFRIFVDAFSSIDDRDVKEMMLKDEFRTTICKNQRYKLVDSKDKDKYSRFIDAVFNTGFEKLINYETFIEIILRDGIDIFI